MAKAWWRAFCARLAATLLAVHRSPELSSLLDTLLLFRFDVVRPADYEVLVERSRLAEEAGYARLA